eukprot:TRINITY_DN225_c0_g1_i4.p1 TRINITY_DN225_c0_g1~~TRINITY_DN225_c0_g1_i4.p1  ORF type:complete len:278 (-),score=20.13 TRINITY_DN225_c0_g1_i4:316-1074(-)
MYKSIYFLLFSVSHLLTTTAQLNNWFGSFWPRASTSCVDVNGDESRTVENLVSCTFTLPIDPLVKKIEDFTEDEAENLVRSLKSNSRELKSGAKIEDIEVQTDGQGNLRVILRVQLTSTYQKQTFVPGSFVIIPSVEVYIIEAIWTGDYDIQFDERLWKLTWDDQVSSVVNTNDLTSSPSDNLLGNAIKFELEKDVRSFGNSDMRRLPGSFEVDEALDRYLFTDNARFSLPLKNTEINVSTREIELVLNFDQ